MWRELREPFSQGNGPKVFQRRRMISTISEENSFVNVYLTKLKGLQDELLNYRSVPTCSCGSDNSMKILLKYQHIEICHAILE